MMASKTLKAFMGRPIFAWFVTPLRRKFGQKHHRTFFLCNIKPWKEPIITELLQANGAENFQHIPEVASYKHIERIFIGQQDPTIVIWGMKAPDALFDYAAEHKLEVWHIEDGFIRSIGLGADHIPPASVIIDKTGGLYFRSDRPSALEDALNSKVFTKSDIIRARSIMQEILRRNATKYNLSEAESNYVIDSTQSNVIIFGQCEDDNSVLYGSPEIRLNTDLIEQVLKDFPDSKVYYRPHPDVTAGLRVQLSDVRPFEDRVCIMDQPYPIWNNIEKFDRVCVMTSLAGFEALMRGKKVKTYGQPFYAGWGLTDDFLPCLRREQCRSLEEVFFGAYIEASTYLVPGTGLEVDIESALQLIFDKTPASPSNPD